MNYSKFLSAALKGPLYIKKSRFFTSVDRHISETIEMEAESNDNIVDDLE